MAEPQQLALQPGEFRCKYCKRPLLRDYDVCPLCNNEGYKLENMKEAFEEAQAAIRAKDTEQLARLLSQDHKEGFICVCCRRGKYPDDICCFYPDGRMRPEAM